MPERLALLQDRQLLLAGRAHSLTTLMHHYKVTGVLTGCCFVGEKVKNKINVWGGGGGEE